MYATPNTAERPAEIHCWKRAAIRSGSGNRPIAKSLRTRSCHPITTALVTEFTNLCPSSSEFVDATDEDSLVERPRVWVGTRGPNCICADRFNVILAYHYFWGIIASAADVLPVPFRVFKTGAKPVVTA